MVDAPDGMPANPPTDGVYWYIKDPDVYRRVLVQGDLGLGESCLATSFRAGKIVTKKIPLIKSYITYITYITYHRNNIVKLTKIILLDSCMAAPGYMDGQWESNDLEAFVFEMLKLEGVKKDWGPIVVISVAVNLIEPGIELESWPRMRTSVLYPWLSLQK